MSKEISLTQGFVAIVDDADYEWLSQWKWHARKGRGERFTAGRRLTSRSHISMHRQIMNTPVGMQTDHINHDTLDNRRKNLRVCTNSQNATNRVKRSGLSSKYMGVSLFKSCEKWLAGIRLKGKTKHLGLFVNEEDAARAYDVAVVEHRDEHATTNFPRQ